MPVIEFRASIIIGSGSLSFEMIRALVERLPVMVTPRRVRVEAQPIAVGDMLEYPRAALTLDTSESANIEIGGPDRVSYGELMQEYARQRGLRLRLQAEMKLPGRAWLESEVQPEGNGTRLYQTAIFDPVGLCGLTYWYAVWPLHQLVLDEMLRGIAKAAAKRQEGSSVSPKQRR